VLYRSFLSLLLLLRILVQDNGTFLSQGGITGGLDSAKTVVGGVFQCGLTRGRGVRAGAGAGRGAGVCCCGGVFTREAIRALMLWWLVSQGRRHSGHLGSVLFA
jgi:hypothetical protein